MTLRNHFAAIGLPCRMVKDQAVHEAYVAAREKWFLRQYDPTHAQEAPQRLQQIEQAYRAIGREADRRRYLGMLMRNDRVLRDRRRAELDGLARRLCERGPLSSQSRDLLRHKASALGLRVADVDRAVPPTPPEPAPHVDGTQRDYFRFCVEMAVDRAYLSDRKRQCLLRQAVALGLASADAQQIIAQVLFASEKQRRTIIDRLLGPRGTDLDATAPGPNGPRLSAPRLPQPRHHD